MKSAKQQKTTVKKKLMISALEKSLGIVSTACKSVGIERSTHYDWIAKDLKYAKKVSEISEMCIDFVESKMYSSISKGSDTLIKYYLSTKAKNRGYSETTNIQHSGTIIESINYIIPKDENADNDNTNS